MKIVFFFLVTLCNAQAMQIVNLSSPAWAITNSGLNFQGVGTPGSNQVFTLQATVWGLAGDSTVAFVNPGEALECDGVDLGNLWLWPANSGLSPRQASISIPSGSGFPVSGILLDNAVASWRVVCGGQAWSSSSVSLSQSWSPAIVFIDGLMWGMAWETLLLAITMVKRGLGSGT